MVRVSGEGTLSILERVFRIKGGLSQRPRRLVSGKVVDPDGEKLLDHAMAVYFPGPDSFTGEDSGEIQGHGGGVLPRLVLELVLRNGARLARPGEFTERAFLNGRLGLDQAEAVAEIVASESEAEARIAARALDGALGERVGPLFGKLKGSLAFLTGVLDFEEDWTEEDRARLSSELAEILSGLDALLELRRGGRLYRDGLRVVLAGPPNAGKSRLFNALLGKNRALVSTVPGTTRDYLVAAVSWGPVKVELVDTAGLREEGQDELEAMGQDLALEQIGESDLVVWLHDLTAPPAGMALEREKSPPIIECWNKLDALDSPPGPQAPGLAISAATGEGLEPLKEAILSRVGVSETKIPDLVPNLRQQLALEEARDHLSQALAALDQGEVPEIAGILLRRSLDALGAITGTVFTDDLLTEVFRHFCLGK
jgi:tRNA modification GTPase